MREIQRYMSEMYGAPGAEDTPPKYVNGDEVMALDPNYRWRKAIVNTAELQSDGVTWVYFVNIGANTYELVEDEITSGK
jgi:hypothetical protein